MASLVGAVSVLPGAVAAARLGTASNAELPPKPERPQQPLTISNGDTSYRSSNRSSGSLGSSALEALVAAAEEADIPRVESEAWEADHPLTLSPAAPCANQGASQSAVDEEEEGEELQGELPASEAADELLPPAAWGSPPARPAADMQGHAALVTPGADPSAAAAAALARFEQLQQQLQTLQASLPPAPLEEEAVAATETCSIAASQPQSPFAAGAAPQAAGARPELAESPVLVVMHQAESFLAQAQALLHRLHAAAARSPQQSTPLGEQHAWQPPGLPAQQNQAAVPAPLAPAPWQQQPHSTSQWPDACTTSAAAAEPARSSSPTEVQGPAGKGRGAHPAASSQQWQGMAWSAGAPAAPPPAAGVAACWPWEQQQQQQTAAQTPQQDLRNSWQEQQQQPGSPPRGLMWAQPEGSFASTCCQGATPDHYHQSSWHQQRQALQWQHQQQTWQQSQQMQRLSMSERQGGYAQRQAAAAAAAAAAAVQAALPSAPARQQQGSYVQAARLAKVGLPRWFNLQQCCGGCASDCPADTCCANAVLEALPAAGSCCQGGSRAGTAAPAE